MCNDNTSKLNIKYNALKKNWEFYSHKLDSNWGNSIFIIIIIIIIIQ